MPNPTIDKFQIGNTTYDFIDSTARNTADAAVPQTRKVNNKALSADVTLTSDDIGYDSTETYSSGTIGNELTQLSTAITQIEDVVTPETDAVFSKNVTSVINKRVMDGISGTLVWLPVSGLATGDKIQIKVSAASDVIAAYAVYFGKEDKTRSSAVLSNGELNYTHSIPFDSGSVEDPYVYVCFYTSVANASDVVVNFEVKKVDINEDSLQFKMRKNLGSILRDDAYYKIMYTDSNGWANEGACTDGSNIYFIRAGSDWTVYELCKYNLSTNELTVVDVSTYSGDLYHANDMTYNPNTGNLYVAAMKDGKIVVFNTSLVYVETITTADHPTAAWAQIAYDRTFNHFYLGNKSGYKLFEYDASFNILREITLTEYPIVSSTVVLQGAECDKYFIYYLYNIKSGSSITHNLIYVYDHDGNFIKTITIALTYEGETICNAWDNHVMYLFCNSTACRISFLALNSGMTIEQYELLQELNA